MMADFLGARGEIRTPDQFCIREPLYQLSYTRKYLTNETILPYYFKKFTMRDITYFIAKHSLLQ